MIPTPPPAGDSEALAELIRQHPMCNEEETYDSDTIVPWWRCLARDITAAGFTRGRSDSDDTTKRLERERDEARAKLVETQLSHAAGLVRLLGDFNAMRSQWERLKAAVADLRAERDALAEALKVAEATDGVSTGAISEIIAERDAAEASAKEWERRSHLHNGDRWKETARANAAESKAAKLAEALRKLVAFVEATDDTVPSLAFARAALAGDVIDVKDDPLYALGKAMLANPFPLTPPPSAGEKP